MAGGGWVDIKKKNTHLEEDRTEDAVGICVIGRSVSLAATGQLSWTAAEVEETESSLNIRAVLG